MRRRVWRSIPAVLWLLHGLEPYPSGNYWGWSYRVSWPSTSMTRCRISSMEITWNDPKCSGITWGSHCAQWPQVRTNVHSSWIEHISKIYITNLTIRYITITTYNQNIYIKKERPAQHDLHDAPPERPFQHSLRSGSQRWLGNPGKHGHWNEKLNEHHL